MLGPKMGLNQQPGRIANAEIEIDEKETATALNRGTYQPSYARNSNAYIGGQSAQQEEQQAYARTAEHTLPGATRQEQAANERLRQEARDMPNPERPAFIAGDPQRGRAQAQQKQQAEQQRQPQAQQTHQPQEEQGKSVKASKHQELNRGQMDKMAAIRGRMDAMESEGKQKFGQRKGLDSERSVDIAKDSFVKTKGKFGQMADRTRSIINNINQEKGHSKERGQSQETETKASSGGRFSSMADRVRAAVRSHQKEDAQQGNGLER